MQVTVARNAKTLSPSHVKQCILAESRFDFLRDLVKNIPDVSAAEEKEMMSAESSPNSSRFSDVSVPPRRIAREDSNSSSSSDIRAQQVTLSKDITKRELSSESETIRPRTETITLPKAADTAIDLSIKVEESKPVRTANFYQETLVDEVQHPSVITVNPTYSSPQPSTSRYINLTPVGAVQKAEVTVPKQVHKTKVYIDVRPNNITPLPRTPVTPILNIDFSKNLAKPEIKVLDTAVASIVGVPKNEKNSKLQRQNSKVKVETKKIEPKPVAHVQPIDIDHLNSGNLQIDEDYDT
ncbi:unnamed protein product [Parnassius apollo]|uniref:(apollo) hypothetical protein n=1 Tax=Parnassius apollo TaxID=110799 RepID=A0A8S3WIW9_PARAO|nr:unnamed protein product [Parnassius apollo]